MTDEELRDELSQLRREVESLTRTLAKLAEHVFGGQITGLMSMYSTDLSYQDWPGRPRPDLVSDRPYAPLRPAEDTLPRGGRNPRIFCEQHESGTWIHGRPHNCPTWARR